VVAPELLARLAPFHGADPRAIAALAAIGVERRVAAGEPLFVAGGPPLGWFVVVTGQVRVLKGRTARAHVLHTEGPGGTLGEMPLFAGVPYPATALAAEPTCCIVFPRAELERVLDTRPAVARILLARLARRVAVLVDRLDERSAQPVGVRLAEFLLRRHAAAGDGVLTLGCTQQELAEELGTVREVVSRGLRALVREGVLVPQGPGRWRVPEVAALRARG